MSAAPECRLPPPQDEPPTSHGAVRGRLLVVDDEPLLLRAFSRVLMRAGHEVDQACDGNEALALVVKQKYDGAFIDLGLPGAGGLEVLAALRVRDPGLPVVLMTGAPTLQTAIDAVGAGALRYLVKPIDAPMLQLAAVDAIAARRHASSNERESGADVAARDQRLDRALELLHMVYQPIVRLGTREVYAYEALVRTREPTVPHPGVLIELAQQQHRLPELGRAIRRAIAASVSDVSVRIFVNLHPIDLLDDDLYAAAAPLSKLAHRVVLEVTERASLDGIADLAARLKRLRALGFRIAIDDLGEGYAGLSSVVRVEPEFVKLDMSLVRDVDRSAAQRHIVGSTVQLCRLLGCEVIAEGVETATERDALVELGCDLLQGYFFARPASAFVVPTFS